MAQSEQYGYKPKITAIGRKAEVQDCAENRLMNAVNAGANPQLFAAGSWSIKMDQRLAH